MAEGLLFGDSICEGSENLPLKSTMFSAIETLRLCKRIGGRGPKTPGWGHLNNLVRGCCPLLDQDDLPGAI